MKRIFLTSMMLLVFVFACLSHSEAQMINLSPETLTYSIKKFGMTAGEATLQYVGLMDLEGRPAIQIIFTAKGFNFYDQEKIFADPLTLLPLRVERDLNIFGKKEKIVEVYDAEHYLVKVTKYDNGKVVDEMIFERQYPIDNLYCFLYRYRLNGVFEKGHGLTMFLPTKTVVFKIENKTEIHAAGKKREAWFMKSEPNEYRVWFGTDSDNLPLRIDGAIGLAKTAMILQRIEKAKID
ncbi:MAG: hypothetical protein AB1650_03430 [Candidatus Omnitrophota bacterium]